VAGVVVGFTQQMTSIILSSIALTCMIGGMLIGLVVRRLVPEQYLRDASRDSVKTGAGLIATLAALVLGLLVTSAKNAFDGMNRELTQACTNIILLDRALAQCGDQTKAAREDLRQTLRATMWRIWPDEFAQPPDESRSDAQTPDERIEASIRFLVPCNESQTTHRAKALKLIGELSELRWLLFEQSHSELPTAFIALLIFWLTVLFGTFGLLAPRNATVVIVVLSICALSVATVIFLIREMNHPLHGVVQVSSNPARQALDQLGR
jgi:hypothetical protein